ncbi:hypothetical protein D7W79_27730 [Corallococcus exercitus]|uniref:hypothetical protein n=1 Tax=Corallococcus exercitus TaxID=2316736 RepID=UPI000EA15E28|nr:hypothetical protein [Corallococcus exercitus]RKG72673.1 hypothetical protein D7W79_27730 [Corallococcus exercitus]
MRLELTVEVIKGTFTFHPETTEVYRVETIARVGEQWQWSSERIDLSEKSVDVKLQLSPMNIVDAPPESNAEKSWSCTKTVQFTVFGTTVQHWSCLDTCGPFPAHWDSWYWY